MVGSVLGTDGTPREKTSLSQPSQGEADIDSRITEIGIKLHLL